MIRILYAVQGTGNGHLSRAMEIVPVLRETAEVDVLVSGSQTDLNLPFPIQYRYKGLSFIFGKNGGIDLLETYRKSHLKKLLREIESLPVDQYDLVISDFEPVSSWACHLNSKPCIALSHQAAVLDKKSPRPRHADPVGRSVMKVYAPCSVNYGFHFKPYNENIFTPVIRKQVREAAKLNKGHYTVYLPAYDDRRIVRMLSQFKGIRWEVFSKHFRHRLSVNDIEVYPIDSDAFVNSMASSEGVLCGAGFETPAEALFLEKKLLVIPMKRQYEQHCNAAALKEMGVPVMKSLKPKHIEVLKQWVLSTEKVQVSYPDCTESIIDGILHKHLTADTTGRNGKGPDAEMMRQPVSVKKLKALTLQTIISKLSN